MENKPPCRVGLVISMFFRGRELAELVVETQHAVIFWQNRNQFCDKKILNLINPNNLCLLETQAIIVSTVAHNH